MAGDKDDDEIETTIVRKGKEAFSFTEMGGFVKDLQSRPLAKLVDDLPGLLELSEAKFALVLLAVSKRMRSGGEEQTAITAKLEELQRSGNPQARKRAEALLKPA